MLQDLKGPHVTQGIPIEGGKTPEEKRPNGRKYTSCKVVIAHSGVVSLVWGQYIEGGQGCI